MDSTNRIERLPGVGREAEHAYIEALRRYLIEPRYAGQTVYRYANCAGHFLRWTQGEQLDLVHIDEVAVARVADELEAPDTRLRRFRAPDALMQFLQAL
jgi:hypothetical protein